jgi:hypothetical protein
MKNFYRAMFLSLVFCSFANLVSAAGHTVSVTPTNAFCFAACNGSATSTVTGGTGPFAYQWLPGNMTTANVFNLCAGSYTLTVTDQSDGSTATATFNIIQPPQITVAPSNVVSPTCGNPNGQACAVASGGFPPYTYNWSPTGGNTACATGLTTGTYTVTVTDAAGCAGWTSISMFSAASPTINVITPSPASICAGQSSILTPNVTGGAAPFTYNWTNPGNSLNSPNVFNPTASPTVSTTYTLTVTDANGCVANNVVTVLVNQAVTGTVSETDPTCNQSNGVLSLNITSGTAPFNILWSNALTTTTINNLNAGLYSVDITDANGCTATIPAGLSNIGGPVVVASTSSASCTNSNNGTATANVTGIAPFTYAWSTSPQQTSQTATGLDAGNYLVSVSDSAGCITVASAQVNALAGNLYAYVYSMSAANCNTSTGAATINSSGGTLPYTYLWSNGATTQSITGVASGVYTVTVSDSNGCAVSGTAAIPAICANIVTGKTFYDVNNDGTFNAGDYPLSGVPVTCTPNYYYTTTSSQGVYSIGIWSADTFDVSTYSPFSWYQLTSPVSGHSQVIFPGLGDTANVDFAFYNPAQFQDLYLSLASGVARTGFPQSYSVHAENRGTTVVSDTIWFIHDSLLSLNYASPAFDGYTYPVGYWLFNNFAPGQQLNYSVNLQIPTIANGGYLGRHLYANARIEPTSADTTSPDNGDDEVDIIVGAYDPNLKECWSPTMTPAGDIWPSDLTLDYTIHFQNSGTDTAFTVVVVDTLPAELDITTFRLGASSNPCTYSIDGYNGTNVVTFTFMNILLPDSNVNEPASHGYVQFTIDHFANLPSGTQIMNEGYNYFDFNPAVVTNMNVVTISDPLTVSEPDVNNMVVYPNPAQDNINVALASGMAGSNATIILRDITGRTITSVPTNGQTAIVINVGSYAEGLYTLTVECADGQTMTQQVIISK